MMGIINSRFPQLIRCSDIHNLAPNTIKKHRWSLFINRACISSDFGNKEPPNDMVTPIMNRLNHIGDSRIKDVRIHTISDDIHVWRAAT